MQRHPSPEATPCGRVVLDASALLSGYSPDLLAAADLAYYTGYWSSWIVNELVRKRTEWIAERATRDGCGLAELRQRLRESRDRVNTLIDHYSGVLRSVDYSASPRADLSWLADRDDWPVMQTALAARADVLITENSSDFPLGEKRHGVLLLRSSAFLTGLYSRFPEAEPAVRRYLDEVIPGQLHPNA